MRILIIGSTVLQARIQEHALKLMTQGHEPLTPVFDSHKGSVLSILTKNRKLMEMSDEVHLIYDGRSYSSIFDFGMCFAMKKPLKIIYISPKNIVDGMREYEKCCKEDKKDGNEF